jgi:murein DD-endopeptidase MepM/ murein hydrolase activator NlpD
MTLLPRYIPVLAGAFVLAGCTDPLDFDLRGNIGGFTTAPAAQGATGARPAADARGVISYPTYQVAVARRDDTVNDVAARVGVDADRLARYNGIDRAVVLRQGEILALPGRVAEPAPGTPGSIDLTTLAGNAIDSAPSTTPIRTAPLEPAQAQAQTRNEPVRHKVERGETAYTIARLYQVPVRSLGEWNGLGPDFAIREGQYLLIPTARGTPPAQVQNAAVVPPPGTGTPTPTPPSASAPLPQNDVEPLQSAAPPAPAASVGTPTAAAPAAAMAMPVDGRIIREYAKGRNDGIDIAAAPGTPVKAAADGTVAAITSDANQVPIIVVRHPDNVLTVYANVDKIAVNKGDTVRRGQTLAALRDGSNAYVHFEVREGFDSVDPAPYLE